MSGLVLMRCQRRSALIFSLEFREANRKCLVRLENQAPENPRLCVPGNRGGGIGEDNFLIGIKNHDASAGLIQSLSERNFWLVIVASWFLLGLIIAINCLKRRLKSSFS